MVYVTVWRVSSLYNILLLFGSLEKYLTAGLSMSVLCQSQYIYNTPVVWIASCIKSVSGGKKLRKNQKRKIRLNNVDRFTQCKNSSDIKNSS